MLSQNLKIDKEFRHGDRIDFFKKYITDKKVLHVGFADYPITKPKKNLHLKIFSFCKILDGIDPNLNEELENILRVPNGKMFNSWHDINDDYDVILVPEVLEHVGNAEDFLKLLDKLKGILIITTPDAYLCHSHFTELDETFSERVHFDHKCWYSPYTLKNTINNACTNKKVQSLHWLQDHQICAVCY